MSEQVSYYREENFSLYQVNNNYSLLLQIHANAFSYAVIYQNRLMAWAEDCDYKELDDPAEEHDLLTYDYKNRVIGLPASGFTLIPEVLYNANHLGDLARFLDVKPTEKVFAQPLDDINYVVYKQDDKIIAQAEKFGLDKTVFMAKGWIAAIAASQPHPDQLYLNLDKKQVEILYFANNKLRFYNTFYFNNSDELAYYAVYVTQELQLKPENLNLVLSGDVIIDDSNAGRLSQFFNGVELNHLRPLSLPAEIPSQKILALAALSLCVSSEVY